MAHQADNNVIEIVVQLLSEDGLSHMGDALRLLLNEAARLRERFQTEDGDDSFRRVGLGSVPQVRGEVEF